MRRIAVAALLLAIVAVPASGADFNDRSTNEATVTTESVTSFLRLWSQGSDPAGLTGYAVKKDTAPPIPAATGADTALTVALGGYKNHPGATLTRVLTLQARDPLPPGVASLTISGALVADPASPRQPLTGFTFSPLGGAPTSSTVTLAPGQKVQLNISVRLKQNEFPGNQILYHPGVRLTVRYPGYAGNFLSFAIPISVWDGNGAGP